MMKSKKIFSALLAVCLLMSMLPAAVWAAESDTHTHTFGASAVSGNTATRTCTGCGYVQTVYDQALDVAEEAVIGENYYLAANVEGVLKYFTTGTVTTTAPYSLVTTERIAVAVPVTLESSTLTNEKFEGGFQFTYDNNGSTARIYCMDVLKDATTAGQTGIMDTGVHSQSPYKNRHSFWIDEVGGVKVLRKYGNDNILVVKYFESTGTYRMLGVPEAELANEGVYPVTLLAEHQHEAGTQIGNITDTGHQSGCWCGAMEEETAHTFGAVTSDATANTQSRSCSACGYTEVTYSTQYKQVKYPTIGQTYYLSANVNGQLLSFLATGGYTETTPYSIKTTTTLHTVTLNPALQAGKGEFQLLDVDGKYLYSVAAGAGTTVSSGYITNPERVSFLMDEVNGVSVIRAYGTQNILVAKYSDAKSAWRIWCLPETELANEGVYPVMLSVMDHTHTYATAYEKDETGHWHSCECGETTAKESHTFENGMCICGKREVEIVLEEGIYYLKAAIGDATYYFRKTGSGEKVTDTAPYSLYTDTDKAKATAVDVIEETTGKFSLAYPYNDTTARIYVYDIGTNGTVDTGVNTKNQEAYHHFQWDGDSARLYQTEGGVRYVLAVQELDNTTTGTKQMRMLAVKESDLSDSIVAVTLETHTEHSVDTWVVETPATATTTGLKNGICTACDRQVQEVIPVLTPAFSGKEVSLKDAFSIRFYVDKAVFTEGVYQDPYVTFQMDGAQTTVSTDTQEEDCYVFTFADITPDEMGKTVTATLYANKNDGTQYFVTTEYSVAQYCYEMLEKENIGDTLRTLLVDTLNFGAACQQYRNSSETPVNAALTDEQRSWGSSDPLRTLETCKDTGKNNGEVKWYGVSLLMGERVQMRVYFDAENAENLTVQAQSGGNTWTLEEVQAKDGRYYVDFSHLAPTQMSDAVIFTVYRGEAAVSTPMCYSLESYAQAWIDGNSASDAQKELVTAMIRYGDAAKAYAQRAFDLQEDVLYLGRTYESNHTQWFNWSASGFAVQFQGSGLQAKIASNAPDATNYAYLKVYVDGAEQEDILLDQTMQTVTLAEGLDPNAVHTVEVRKRNSPRSSTAGVLNMELLDGQKLAPPAAKERLIEFVGDSLTVGYSAADVNKTETAWSTKTEDGTKTYSKQVADALNAEYMVTAISGRGVVMNNSGGSGYVLPEVYPELDIYNIPGTDYDFALQPDVIVINLGTNDATNSSLDLTAFQAGVVDFIELVRQNNPNAQILWAYGMRNDKMTAQVAAAIEAAVAQIHEAGDLNVYYLPLALAGDMHLNHPTAAAYAPAGELLIEKINEITGWEVSQ